MPLSKLSLLERGKIMVAASYAQSLVWTILLIALAAGIGAFLLIVVLPILVRIVIGLAVIALGIYALVLILRVLRR